MYCCSINEIDYLYVYLLCDLPYNDLWIDQDNIFKYIL